jgi:hypothetical protein
MKIKEYFNHMVYIDTHTMKHFDHEVNTFIMAGHWQPLGPPQFVTMGGRLMVVQCLVREG